ncbi:outer membrane usher protein PefC [Salmonella enterica subsp. enterica serovar Javiana]|nr:outer membrane usher protein PefC [Salmonella enterica subsp. enterica serovar Javiana]ECV1375370.1 outer membrane usher protein PefC [Salmonella enterica subsp. enterica serovar Javiana]EEI9041254.1 PefC/AfrB family outer membrane usher protein [Salmonella enterica subsp. enterica serovar Javiana]
MSRPQIFKLSALTLSLFSQCTMASGTVTGAEDTELNTGFLQGVSVVPSVLKSGVNFPAGQYYVDVVVNNDNVGKTPLTISAEEEKADMLCLSPEWLKTAGVPVRLDSYAAEYRELQNCYQLARSPYTRVDFNQGNQSLVFSIPQSAVISKTDPSQWDYGVNAFRLQYSGNMNHATQQGTSAYGSVALDMNVGRWVLSSNMNGTRSGSDGRTDFSVRDAGVSTAISPIRSDLRIGKSWTRNDQFADFGFYGVSLRSNSNMTPWDLRGYAPLISGVATSTSRITITQNGYTMYSRVVQPGPYELNDVRPVGNGDLEVTVEDANGRKTVTRYPVTTLPTLLRPGELQYDLSLGRRSTRSDIDKPFSEGDKGLFWSGSLAYGLGSTTLSGASILHNHYRSGGLSVTQTLGGFGAVSVGGAVSQAEYDRRETVRGHSVSAKYAKSFTDTTNLQLMAYRYQSKGFVEFANFDPTDRYRRDNQKSRYEMQLTQRLPWGHSLSLSGWREDYWNRTGYSAGTSLGTGFTLFDDVSFSVNAGYSKSPYREKADYNGSLSVSIPFSMGGARYYNTSSVSHNSGSGARFQTTLQGNPTDRLGYSVSAAGSDKGSRSTSASVNYGFDTVQTGAGISQDRHTTSLNGSISGSVVATAESGLLFTRDQSTTMGVVRVPDVAGVRFNGSPGTNSKGYTVVGLSDYSENRIDIDMQYVPDNLELDVTSYSVVPTEKAVVYREFGANHVKRYFLQVRDTQGQLMSGGHARTEQGLDAGFIARNGVLSMSLLSEPKEVKVSLGGGGACRISMAGISPGADKVQEVRCE